MKKRFTIPLTAFFLFTALFLQAQFGNDVKIYDEPTRDQKRIDLDVAFNGWVYETFDTDTGYYIMLSKDDGATWSLLYLQTANPNVVYSMVRLTVAGTDTNNLRLFVANVNFNTATGVSVVFVDMFDARTGAFIDEYFSLSYVNSTRAIDLATDYKSHGGSSSPYSISLLYARGGALYDSLFIVTSTDGGLTYGVPRLVRTTVGFIRDVSISHSRSNWSSGGRYYMAWSETSTYTALFGNIYVSHSANSITDNPTPPLNLDSLNSYCTGYAMHPCITAAQNAADNDSGQLSVLVTFDRYYNGGPDIDVLGFYTKTGPNSNNWYRLDIDNNSNNVAKQANASFDPVYNNFLVTYFDSTNQKLIYVVKDFNFGFPDNWSVVSTNYVDGVPGLTNPWPVVVINPVYTNAAFGWTGQNGSNGIAYFDAEYSPVNTLVKEITGINSVNIFPNPANHNVNIEINSKEPEEVQLNLYDMSGRLVTTLGGQFLNSGTNTFTLDVTNLPAALYHFVAENNGARISRKISVLH